MRVLVAMSGGVDSSVAAALLLEQGHDVVGATMKLCANTLLGLGMQALAEAVAFGLKAGLPRERSYWRADALMEQGLRETDPAKAKQVWQQYSTLLQQDQPVTFLFWSEDMAGVGPRLQGVEMDARSKLANVRDWWIPADRRR